MQGKCLLSQIFSSFKKNDQAIEHLTKISTSTNSKIAEKAKHNLSVAEELKKYL